MKNARRARAGRFAFRAARMTALRAPLLRQFALRACLRPGECCYNCPIMRFTRYPSCLIFYGWR